MYACVRVCERERERENVHVCVCMYERQTDRETDRQTLRQTERDREDIGSVSKATLGKLSFVKIKIKKEREKEANGKKEERKKKKKKREKKECECCVFGWKVTKIHSKKQLRLSNLWERKIGSHLECGEDQCHITW